MSVLLKCNACNVLYFAGYIYVLLASRTGMVVEYSMWLTTTAIATTRRVISVKGLIMELVCCPVSVRSISTPTVFTL